MSWRRNLPRRSKRCLLDFVPPDESPRHERLRIARDLHDTFAQSLAGLGYSLDSVIADESLSARSKRELRSIRLDLSGILQELRDEILALRHQEGGLNRKSAIENWLRTRLPIEINWVYGDLDDEKISSRQELSHLLLELLNNAITYQGVTRIEIEDSKHGLDVRFHQEDGYLPKSGTHSTETNLPKLGRLGIIERVKVLDAELREHESGFTLRWQE